MELRPLNSSDLWQMVRILGKLNIRNLRDSIDTSLLKKARFEAPKKMEGGEMVPLPESEWTAAQIKAFNAAASAKDTITWQIMDVLVNNIGNCEQEVNALLASGAGVSVDEITAMPPLEYLELIEQYVSREDFRDFFTKAVNSLGKKNVSQNITASAAALLTK